jgi:hypothetical protein
MTTLKSGKSRIQLPETALSHNLVQVWRSLFIQILLFSLPAAITIAHFFGHA